MALLVCGRIPLATNTNPNQKTNCSLNLFEKKWYFGWGDCMKGVKFVFPTFSNLRRQHYSLERNPLRFNGLGFRMGDIGESDSAAKKL